jgi:FixJ family two-component response regulator
MSISPSLAYVVVDASDSGEGLERLLRASDLQTRWFKTGQAFLDAYPNLPPGCLFVDLARAEMNGLLLLQRLRAAGCRWPVVIVTEYPSAVSAADAMQEGAFALLEKPLRELEVLAAAREAQAYLAADPHMMRDEEIARRIKRLSPREREVLDYVLQGLLNKQIAARLGIAESTVKGARRALMQRMRAGTTAELILLAVRGGVTTKT